MNTKTIVFSLALLLLWFTSAGAQPETTEPTVHHIVLISLKDGVTDKQIAEMKTVCEALLNDIPGVIEVSLGKKARDNREVHIKDYDVALHVTWQANAVGDTYATHILHLSFLKLYKPLFAGIKVIDFYGN
ncbi:Dabb family protein [Sedimenticola sp.]|uniref:Dabb family protein n=1 Tax=Sedimenticola sp. TaxID=1940285 RepID=UPI003D0B483C